MSNVINLSWRKKEKANNSTGDHLCKALMGSRSFQMPGNCPSCFHPTREVYHPVEILLNVVDFVKTLLTLSLSYFTHAIELP